jgi:hypothetical protein
MRKVIRIDLEWSKRLLNRPGFAEAIAGALEQLVIGLGASRIVALHIKDVPPPDRADAVLRF